MSEAFLNFASQHQFHLLPIVEKKPAIAGDWRALATNNRLQWEKWIADGFGLAVYAKNSQLFIADVDTKHVGRDAAWPIWYGMAQELGIDALKPHVHTPSGGFHYWLRLPPSPPSFRGVHKILDNDGREFVGVRHAAYAVACAQGYTFCEESLQDASPKLIEVMRPAPRKRSPKPAEAPKSNEWNAYDAENMIRFVAQQDGWKAREDWLNLGMGLRLAFGEAGRALWWASDNGTMKSADDHQFDSFRTEFESGCVTLATSFAYARKLGWNRSVCSMFGGVSVSTPFAGDQQQVAPATQTEQSGMIVERPAWHHECIADAYGRIIPKSGQRNRRNSRHAGAGECSRI